MAQLDLHALANSPTMARPVLRDGGYLNGDDPAQPLWQVIARGFVPVACMMRIHAETADAAMEIAQSRLETEPHKYTFDETGDACFDTFDAEAANP